MVEQRAFWVAEPGRGEIRAGSIADPGEGEVLVRTRWSGISRGTERLVFEGRVPASERERMRAPFQEGAFPAPVKYGYLNVGVVERGPRELLGRTVFSLAPHQTLAVLPASAVIPAPPGVPARRAVLAGLVETAVNALWDVPVLVGDRVAVVGAGAVGCAIARLAARQAGTTVTLIDRDEGRRSVADALGVAFATPEAAPVEQDVVFHASATAAGLARSLELLRTEGTAADVSWYGDAPVAVPLGGPFHARRLSIRSSQVGTVAPARAGTSSRERLTLALELVRDDAFDALLTATSPFDELPAVMAGISAGTLPGLVHTLDYRTE